MVEQGNVVMAELTGTAKRAGGGEMHMSMAEVSSCATQDR